MRSLRTAFSNIRRSPYQALVAFIMMSLTFFIIYCFVIVLIGSNIALRYLETRPQVTAFFTVNTPMEKVQAAAEAMKAKDYVASVKVVTNDDALTLFQEQNQKDQLLLQLVTADILPSSIEVSAKDIQSLPQIRDDVGKLENIDEVVYQKDVIENLTAWTKSIRLAGISISAVLLFVTLLFVSIILSLRVAMKRNEISIMRLLGASSWFIRGPFLFEGLLYGSIGSLIGWVGMFILLLYLSPSLLKFFGSMIVFPFPVWILLALLGGGILTGIILGTIASFFAVKRFIRL